MDANNKAIAAGESKSTLKYRGYEYDEETKLYYLNCRMYDPSIARFLQEDTYRGQLNDPLSLNLYTYCDNNPIVYVDPTGHGAATMSGDFGGLGNKKNGFQKLGDAIKNGFENVKRFVDDRIETVKKERAERDRKEKAEDDRREKVEKEKRDKAEREKAEREKRDKVEREKRDKVEREKREREERENEKKREEAESKKKAGKGTSNFWDDTTPPLKRFGVPTICSSGEIADVKTSTLAGSATGTVMGNVDKVTKPKVASVDATGTINFEPAETLRRTTPSIFKEAAKVGRHFGTLATASTTALDMGNTWTADSGNTNLQRVEKTFVQGLAVGTALSVGKGTAALASAGFATSEFAGAGLLIVVAAAALDEASALVIEKAQNGTYKLLDIK